MNGDRAFRDASVRFQKARDNLPSRKPELWEHPARAVLRRVSLEILSRIKPSSLDRPQVVTILNGAARMEVVPRDATSRAIFLYGVYEPAVTRLLQGALRPGDTFVDVGANRGYYAILGAKLVGVEGSVHAFEPVETLQECLRRNVALNELASVHCHSEAVWECDGTVPFFETRSPENSGLSSVLAGAGRARVARMVPAVTLDSVAAAVGRIAAVKLDIEGGELAALRGASQLLRSPDPPIIAFESFELAPVRELLRESGYDVRSVGFTRARGLEFIRSDERGAGVRNRWYEPPNFVAVARRASRRFWPAGEDE